MPLILIAVIARHDVPGDRLPGGARVSPRLAQEERLRLATFLRDCKKSDECDSPLGCLKYWRLKRQLCVDSDCETDLQCQEGETCQVLPSEGDGPRIRMCLQQGERREGEECDLFPLSRQEACGPGLLCREGRCGRACKRDESGDCPDGFFCSSSPEGSVCLPTCEERGCPPELQCVQFNRVGDRRVSACVKLRGENCQQTPCGEGRQCLVLHEPEHPGEARMVCATRCGEHQPACPEGLICNRLYCRRPCDPKVPDACGPDRECSQLKPEEPWVCPLGS